MHTPLALSMGWYGKLPSRGDFVGRGMPRAWLRTWDDWLQRAMAGAALRWGSGLREHLLAMPPWQGIVLPSQPGMAAWCVVVAASVDRVGRAFPMLLGEAHEQAALNEAPLATWQARGLDLVEWLVPAMSRCAPKEFESGIARWAALPWPAAGRDADERLAHLHERWPAAASFWWRAEPDADMLAPLVQAWPPRESLMLDWLGDDDTAPSHDSGP